MPRTSTKLSQSLLLCIIVALSSGCAVIAVADAAVTTAAVVVKTGASVTGAAIDMVIPDDEDENTD